MDEQKTTDEPVAAEPEHEVTPTEQMPSPADSPAVQTEPATLQDVAQAAESYARSRIEQAAGLIRGRGAVLLAVAVVAIAAIAALTLAMRSLADLPEVSLVERDAREHFGSPAYDGGSFGAPASLVLADVDVDTRTKEGGQCLATALLRYTNGAVSALQQVQLAYGKEGPDWVCGEAIALGGPSYAAETGVDHERVVASIDEVLGRAEASLPDDGSTTSLATLYHGAEVEVVEDAFDPDAQTDTVTLALSQTQPFTARQCTITASFAFRPGNGLWELTKATASTDARDLSFSPLVGTWTGTLQGQETTGDGKCLGAKEVGVIVTISSAQASRIAGTVSGLAHSHGDLAADAEGDQGDAPFGEVAFTGELSEGAGGITFACSVPEASADPVELTLSFGTQDDPSAAVATLTTRHSYLDFILFIPYEREATFSDTFLLTRS